MSWILSASQTHLVKSDRRRPSHVWPEQSHQHAHNRAKHGEAYVQQSWQFIHQFLQEALAAATATTAAAMASVVVAATAAPSICLIGYPAGRPTKHSHSAFLQVILSLSSTRCSAVCLHICACMRGPLHWRSKLVYHAMAQHTQMICI